MRNLRESSGQEFAPWSYFGAAETGIYRFLIKLLNLFNCLVRIWPGARRKDDPNGSECAPYDPVIISFLMSFDLFVKLCLEGETLVG